LASPPVPGNNDDVGDLEGADPSGLPIDDYIFLFAIIGIVIAFLKFKQFRSTQT